MTLVLLLSAIILGFLFEKSKAVSAYMLSVMYLLAAFNYDNADYSMYTISYANSAGFTYNFRYIGYSMFVHFFSSQGVPYSQYLKIAFIPIFIILYIAICKLTDRPNRVLALFLVFPFGIDYIQVKAFFSEAFGLLGIALLIDKLGNDMKKQVDFKLICSMAFFVLSVLFHFSGFFYVVVAAVFYCFRNKHWFNKAIIIASVVGFVAVLSGILARAMSIAGSIGIISDTEYLSGYATKATRLGFVVTFIPALLMVGACWFLFNSEESDERFNKKQVLIRQFMLTGLMVLPLLVMHMVFDRLARVYMIMMYSLFANAPRPKRITTKQFFAYAMFVVSIIWFFGIDILSAFDGTLLALLKNSDLFSMWVKVI